MITEAVILAGGLGTRLRSAVPDLPKCMAPVAGQPFIDYVLQYLAGQGITHFVLALGYQAPIIEQHIQANFSNWNITFSIENEPLGTGGAIALACTKITGKYALVTNGDTLYKADVAKAFEVLNNTNAACVLMAKPMQNADRYGAIAVNERGIITAFQEKQFFENALINGGLYALEVPSFLQQHFPSKFSFEKDFLEKSVASKLLYAVADDGYFIDIGIPEDYERANRDLISIE